MSNLFLPSDRYKNRVVLYNDFNSDLIRGISQGLSVRDNPPEKDLELYKNIDTKPIEQVSFDNINNKIKDIENDSNNVLKSIGKGVNSFVSEIFGINSENMTKLGLFILVLIVIYKKI